MSTRRAYLSTIVASTAIQAAGIVTGILSARLLGPENRGLQALIVLIPSLTFSLANLSLPFATAYLLSKDPTARREIASATFWLSLLISLCLAACLYVILDDLIPPDKRGAIGILRWYVWLVPFNFVSASLLGVDHGAQGFLRYNLLRALPPVIYVAGMIGLWAAGSVSLAAVAGCNFIAGASVCVIRTFMMGPSLLPKYFKISTATTLLMRGMKLHVPALSSIALMNIDMVLLSRTVDSESLGFYAAALALAMGQYGLASVFMQVGFVKIAGQTSEQSARDTLVRHARYAQITVGSVCLVMTIGCPWIIPMLFGAEFASATPIATYLIFAKGLYGLVAVFDNFLRSLDRSLASTTANLLGLSVAVVGGLMVVPTMGATGMAMAMCAAMVVALFFCFVVCHLRFGIPFADLWGLRVSVVRDICKHCTRLFTRGRGIPAHSSNMGTAR